MTVARRRLGKYELVARIGEGGMADVHLARQLGPRQFEKLVVVKTVKPALASRPELAAMLLEEARLAALVKHANVVDIYELGEADGTFFIAMEYLEGEALSAVLVASRGGTRLDPFSTTRIIADCAAGLHAAHELRSMAGDPMELVHQDVTPGNVIVLYSGQVKLVDFGVARARTSAHDGLVKGKTGYLAPELLDGKPPDRRSDVWSLGVVLWEALTLRRLFAGKTEAEAVARIRSGEIPAPSRLAPSVPRELDDVCLRALVRDPAGRYQTAHEIHADLEMILRHASWSTHAPIAKFMRGVFSSRIAARTALLRELASAKGPRAQTLDQIQSITDDEAFEPSEGDVVGAHGVGVRARNPGGTIPPPSPQRRRKVAIAASLGLCGIVAIGFAARGGGGASKAVAPDAAVVARVQPPAVDAATAAVVEEPAPDAAVLDADAGPAAGSGTASGSGTKRPPVPDHGTVAVEPPSGASAKSMYKDGLKKFVGGDASGAIKLFDQSRKKDPGYAPAYRGLGIAYEKLGKRDKAASAFKTYLRLSPNASDATSIRARLEKLE